MTEDRKLKIHDFPFVVTLRMFLKRRSGKVMWWISGTWGPGRWNQTTFS